LLGGATLSNPLRSPDSEARLIAPDPFFPDLRIRRLVFGAILVGLVAFGLTSVRARAQVANVAKHDSDFTCYTAAGAAAFAGQDPYAATNPRGWHYLYPPLFAMLVAPLHRLHPELQAVAWFLVNVALIFACYFECARIVAFLRRTEAGMPRWLAFTPFLSVFLFGITCLELGQVSILLLYLLVLGLRLVLCGRSRGAWFAGGVVMAGAVALKLVPALPAVVLLAGLLIAPHTAGTKSGMSVRAPGTTAGLVAGGFVFFLLLPGLLVGWNANLGYLHGFIDHVVTNPNLGRDAHINVTGPGNQSWRFAARNLGNWIISGGAITPQVVEVPLPEEGTPVDSRYARMTIRVFVALLLVALAIAGWRLARAGPAVGLAAAYALACTATLVLPPISWSHMFVLLLLPTLFVPWWAWSRGYPRLALVVAAIPLLLELQHYLLRNSLRLVGVLGVGTALWLVAVCVLVTVLPSPSTGTRGHTLANGEA
jgi:hypothetical protein